MQFGYRKHSSSVTFYRLIVFADNIKVKCDGIQMNVLNPDDAKLKLVDSWLETTEQKDAFYEETEPSTETEFNYRLLQYIELHDACVTHMIGGPPIKNLF